MKTALSLADIESFDPHAKGKGRNRRYCCPLCHGDRTKNVEHRSLSLNADSGAWRCWRCGESGLVVEKQTRAVATRPRPVQIYAPKAKVEFASETPRELFTRELGRLVPIEGTPGADYLQSRGISPEVAAAGRVRFSTVFIGERAVVFPLYAADGKTLLGIHGRSIDTSRKRTINATESGDKGGFHALAPMKSPLVLLVEAPLCALSLAVCGIPSLACNGTAPPQWLPDALFCRHALIGYDRDDAGEEAAVTLGARLALNGCRSERLRPPAPYKDWNEALLAMGAKNLRAVITSTVPELSDPFHDA